MRISDEAMTAALGRGLKLDDLCGGRARGISVAIDPSSRDGTAVGNPRRTVVVNHIDAEELETADDIWEQEPSISEGLVGEVAKLVLHGASATEPVSVNNVTDLRRALGPGPSVLMLPWEMKASNSLPELPGKLVLGSRGVEPGEAFILCGPDEVRFALAPAAALTTEGLRYRAVYSVHVARLGGRTTATRVLMPIDVAFDLWAEGQQQKT